MEGLGFAGCSAVGKEGGGGRGKRKNGVNGRRHPGLRMRPVKGMDGVFLHYHTARGKGESNRKGGGGSGGAGGQRMKSPPPVLFLPYGPHSPWLFEENFMPYFARRGIAAYTFDRHHMNGDEGMKSRTLEELCEELETVASTLPTPPVILGHGAGGFIAQECLRRRLVDFPAAILSCPVPPSGSLPLLARQFLRSPSKAFNLLCNVVQSTSTDSPSALRSAFFSKQLSERRLKEYLRRAKKRQETYGRNAQLGYTLGSIPSDEGVRSDCLGRVLVLGADNDYWIDAEALEETARYWNGRGSRPMVVRDAPHNFMLDQNWRKGADVVVNWLQRLAAADDLMRLLPAEPDAVMKIDSLSDLGL